MSATLYTIESSPRSQIVSDLAKYLNLDVKVVTDRDSDSSYTTNFPLNKAPAFIGKHGFKLSETLAILYYFLSLTGDQELEKQLLGTTIEEKASVLRWMSLANSDLCNTVSPPMLMLVGIIPLKKDVHDSCVEQLGRFADFYDQALSGRSYLSSDTIMLGDLMSYYVWAYAFQGVVGSDFRDKHPLLMKWFNAVGIHPLIQSTQRKFELKDRPLTQ